MQPIHQIWASSKPPHFSLLILSLVGSFFPHTLTADNSDLHDLFFYKMHFQSTPVWIVTTVATSCTLLRKYHCLIRINTPSHKNSLFLPQSTSYELDKSLNIKARTSVYTRYRGQKITKKT